MRSRQKSEKVLFLLQSLAVESTSSIKYIYIEDLKILQAYNTKRFRCVLDVR